jgi:hypothetical protein
MPAKKDPAALLRESPQPPLRRGRGLRLSRASKRRRDLPLEASVLPESFTPAAEPSAVAAESSASLPPASAPRSVSAPSKPARDKRKLKLRKDLLKKCKLIARAQDRKLYQVIESALEEYIQRHGARE